MKIYAPREGFTQAEMANGQWSLYVDVKCVDCGKEYAASFVGGIGGQCLKCGGRCL